MMIQRRTKPHVAKHGEVAGTGGRAGRRRSLEPADHWAFLDEIEAPMWADLSVEATSHYKDYNDNWFHTSHPFHQCSSRKLRSALSHSGEAKVNVGLGMKGSSSPKLPPSVSKSRGKDYKSKDWNHSSFGTIASKQHPIKNLNGKSSGTSSGSGQKLKAKPNNDNRVETGRSKVSNDNRKETGTSKVTSACESSLTESIRLSSSNPADTRVSKAATNSSTITYESSEKQQSKFCEVSNQAFGQTSVLLSVLKLTQRKSCVRRQALRVESVGERQSGGRNSSTGKSSVGSSTHPFCDDGNVIDISTLKSKDATPESRNVNRMPSANMDKVIVLATSKKSNAESLATRCGRKTITTKFAHEKTAKSKVCQVVNTNAMRLHKGNESLAAVTNRNCKTEAKKCNKLGYGKENAKIRTTAGGGGVAQVQKVKKPNAVPEIHKLGLIGTKVKNCSQDERKSSTSVTRNIHFR